MSATEATSGPDHAVWYGLGLTPPGSGSSGSVLATIGATSCTITTGWTAVAAALAHRRRTPLVVIDVSGHANGARWPAPVAEAERPWPVVAITDSPWVARAADLGLLVGRRGPADHDGLDAGAAAALAAGFLRLCDDGPPAAPSSDASLLEVVPFPIADPYAIEDVLAAVVDGGAWMAFDHDASDRVITAVGRIDGRSVGIVASCAGNHAGALDDGACRRVERLVGWCARGGLPVIFLVDSAGLDRARLDTGVAVGAAGAVRSAEVLKLAVVLGRSVGLAATVLGAVGARADAVLPWPRARFALDAIDGRADVDQAASVLRAAREGDVFDVIHPDDTRPRLTELLDVFRGRREYRS